MGLAPPLSVLCIGALIWDELLFVDAIPKEGTSAPARIRTGAVGGIGRCALVAAKMGHHVTVRAQVGTGPGAQEAVAEISVAGVRHELVPVDAARVSSILMGGVDRTIIGAPKVSPAVDFGPVPPDTSLILCDGSEAQAFARAVTTTGAGVLSSFDAGERPRDGVLGALRLANIAVGHGEFMAHLLSCATEADAAAELLAGAAQLVVFTDGPGAVHVYQPGTMFTAQPPTVEAVDTTGCGDVFHAVLATLVAAGKDPRHAVQQAMGRASTHAGVVGNETLR